MRTPSPPPDARLRRLLTAWWAVLAAGLLGFVWRFGTNLPAFDEWDQIAPLAGEAPVWPWLWEPHNEHRYPLPRAVWWLAHQSTGRDFRAGMVVSVVAVATAGLALLRAVWAARGRASPADALVPALLLHVGYWENWLTGYQLAFTLPAALAVAGTAALVGGGRTPAAGRLAAAGGASALLTLCGGAGVVLAVPLAGATLVAACQSRRPALLVLPLAALAAVGWYLLDRPPSPTPPPPSTVVEKVAMAVEQWTVALGPWGQSAWPWSGVLAAGLVAVSFGLAVHSLRDSAGRWPTVWALAGAAGGLGVTAAVAAGRTGLYPGIGFSSRYGAFAAVAGVCLYAAATVGRPPGRRTWLGAVAAVGLAAGAVPGALPFWVFHRYAGIQARDRARQGAGPDELADFLAARVYAGHDPGHRASVRAGLEVLQRHRFGPYR